MSNQKRNTYMMDSNSPFNDGSGIEPIPPVGIVVFLVALFIAAVIL